MAKAKTSQSVAQGAQASQSPFVEFGATGLRQFFGVVNEEWLPELRGANGRAIIRRMLDNDAVIGAIRQAIYMILRGVEWKVKAASDSPQDQANADFLAECLDDLNVPFSHVIEQGLSFLWYGWSLHEIVYKLRDGQTADATTANSKFTDGRIGWRKFGFRSQDTLVRWIFDDTGGIAGFVQRDPIHGREIVIPIDRALLWRSNNEKGSPEGRSILRSAYKEWVLKSRAEDLEMMGTERDLAGFPVMYVPEDLLDPYADAVTKAKLAAAQSLVTQIRRDQKEGAVLPSSRDAHGQLMYELKLLTSGGRRSFDLDAIIQRRDQRIAMSVLADFILLGHQRVGSFALSSEKTGMFDRSLKAYTDDMAEIFNRFAVPRLFEINGLPLDSLPNIDHGDISQLDLQALSAFIGALTQANVSLTDAGTEEYLRDLAGLPDQFDTSTRSIGPGKKAKKPGTKNAGPVQVEGNDRLPVAAPAGGKAGTKPAPNSEALASKL